MDSTSTSSVAACTALLSPFWGRVYAVRVFEPGRGYGDPWAYSLILRDDRPGLLRRLWLRLRGRPVENVAYLCLTHVSPSGPQVEAMRLALLAAGYDFADWERHKNRRVRVFRLNLHRPARRGPGGRAVGGPAPSDEGCGGGSTLLPGQEAVREALAAGELCGAWRRTTPFTCESCLEVAVDDDHGGDVALGGGVNYAPVCRRCVGEFYAAKADGPTTPPSHDLGGEG